MLEQCKECSGRDKVVKILRIMPEEECADFNFSLKLRLRWAYRIYAKTQIGKILKFETSWTYNIYSALQLAEENKNIFFKPRIRPYGTPTLPIIQLKWSNQNSKSKYIEAQTMTVSTPSSPFHFK